MIARIRKAVLAGLTAAAAGTLLGAYVRTGTMPGWPEVGAAVGVGVAAGWAVYRVPNAPPRLPEGVNPTGPYVGRN